MFNKFTQWPSLAGKLESITFFKLLQIGIHSLGLSWRGPPKCYKTVWP